MSIEKILNYQSSSYSFQHVPNKQYSVTFLYFTAKWCDACKCIDPLFEDRTELFGEYAHFEMFDVDEDENDKIAIQYKITKIPTIIVIKNGKVINHINEHITEDSFDVIIQNYLDLTLTKKRDITNTEENTEIAMSP
jgi:thioredoxin 1